MKAFSRRKFVVGGGLAAVAGSGWLESIAPTASAQTSAAPTPPAFTPFQRFPRSVHEYFVKQAQTIEREADARRAALRTRADAERYVAEVREKVRSCFGPFPEKPPLNPRVTAIHSRDGYRVENVIFDSRPNFPVTANLYLPTSRKGPFPGVVATCGHSKNGKAAPPYQSFAQGLARQGYATLIFDPMGQGERLQHTTERFAARFGIGTTEHVYVGNRMTLVDENLPAWFAWDGIRALDYLLSRPEVDPRHVGVTGNSGGGTQATWLCAVEPRFTMAAPSCFVTTFRRNIENEESQDSEQYPWRALALGLDHSDFLAAMAPKPLRILGQERDYFDARGFEQAAERLRHLYRLLGAEENFSSFLGPDPHGYSKLNREAMYGWFNQHTKISDGNKEPEITLEEDATLQCVRDHGQIAALTPASALTFIRKKSQQLTSHRSPLTGEKLKETLIEVLKIPPRESIPDYRILRSAGVRGYPQRAAYYVVETEPDIPVVVVRLSETSLLSRVPRGPTRALLYVSQQSVDAELRHNTWLRELISKQDKTTALFFCDVRGIGESKPLLSTPEFAAKGGTEYFHAGLSLMLDRPMAGQRTFDLLRVIDWLQSYGHKEIHLVSQGEGTVPATFAGILHNGISKVTLRHALRNYSEVAEAEVYRWPLSSLVPRVLTRFDLEDCYRALANKSLELLDPVGAEGVPGPSKVLTS